MKSSSEVIVVVLFLYGVLEYDSDRQCTSLYVYVILALFLDPDQVHPRCILAPDATNLVTHASCMRFELDGVCGIRKFALGKKGSGEGGKPNPSYAVIIVWSAVLLV